MFNLSLPELLVIGAAGLLVFGPKRLPELAKSLGKGIRDFKKAMDGEDDEKSQQAQQPGVTPLPPGSPVVPNDPHASNEPEVEKVPQVTNDPNRKSS
jgi:sec-independent protein translocase protein TatA